MVSNFWVSNFKSWLTEKIYLNRLWIGKEKDWTFFDITEKHKQKKTVKVQEIVLKSEESVMDQKWRFMIELCANIKITAVLHTGWS